MLKPITSIIKVAARAGALIVACLLLPANAVAWTRADLATVDVNVDIDASGEARIATVARFEVSGGRFHGFDLAPLDHMELVPADSSAVTDSGVRHPLQFSRLKDGRTRVVLADGAHVSTGIVGFQLVHRSLLSDTAALRRQGTVARLNWTPIIWDHGSHAMTVTVTVPDGAAADLRADNEVTADYEITRLSDRSVQFRKYRTVKWYPMQIVVDFNPDLVRLSGPDIEETLRRSVPAAAPVANEPVAPVSVALSPVLLVLLSLALMVAKAGSVRRAHRMVGVPPRFRFLSHTGTGQRVALAAIAATVGLGAFYAGSLAAAVPAVAVALGLWMIERVEGPLKPRPGGCWRPMEEADVEACRRVLAAYRRARRSILDVTTVPGAMAFVLAAAAVAAGAWSLRVEWIRYTWSTVVFGTMGLLCVWFSFSRAELPVDATVETFSMLKKWRRQIAGLVHRVNASADVGFFVREDEEGPAEIRLRANALSPSIPAVEIAAEVVRCGTVHQVRKVAILRLLPGTEFSRRVAACPNAAEHHLTADLQQEIIVLRNRRGQKEMGLGSLKAAFALLRP